MSLYAKIKDHPLVVMTGTAVTAGAVVVAVTTYFCQQLGTSQLLAERIEWQRKVAELSAQVASIDRRLGQDRLLDLRKLTKAYGPEDIDMTIPGLTHFRSHGFWALSDTKKWETRSLSEAEHVREVTGILLQEVYDSTTLSKLGEVQGWRWLGKKGLKYRYLGRKEGQPEELPFIMVYKFDHLDNLNYLRILNSAIRRQAVRAGDGALREIKRLAMAMSPLVEDRNRGGIYQQKDDVLGTLLLLILRQIYNPVFWSDNLSVIANNIQKSDEIAYAQLVVKEKDIEVEGQGAGELYGVREFIIFRGREGFMMISTYIPTTKPALSGGFFSDLNTWLISFHLAQVG